MFPGTVIPEELGKHFLPVAVGMQEKQGYLAKSVALQFKGPGDEGGGPTVHAKDPSLVSNRSSRKHGPMPDTCHSDYSFLLSSSSTHKLL